MRFYFGGGINESAAPDIAECAEGSYNFELAADSYKLSPRSPFDLSGTAPNSSDVRGLMQLVKRDDTSTTLVQAGDTVYRWDGNTTWSSFGTVSSSTSQLRDTYWSLGDYLVITDLKKLTAVKKYDGTTFGTLTTGLGSGLYAKYGIVHHGRVWLFNVTTSSDTPHLMVASAFENPTSYDTTQRATSGTFSTGLEAFYMLTPDLRPINGVAKTVAGDLVISTLEGSLFKLSGTSASNYKFDNFYPGSQAVGSEAIVASGNDVLYMRKGGRIESLEATQKYGDVEADDLSRWIINTVRDQTDALAVYDQARQKVFFFLSGKVLVYFKNVAVAGALVNEAGEKKRLSPWSIYRTGHSSGFSTSAAKYMRMPGTTTQTVYFGGPVGQVFNLNGTGSSGDGGTTDINLQRVSRVVDAKLNHITRGTVQYRRRNRVSFNINVDWSDEYSSSEANVVLAGAPSTAGLGAFFGGTVYFGGAYYFNSTAEFLLRISHQNFSVVGKGTGCTVTFSSTDVSPYQVDYVEFL